MSRLESARLVPDAGEELLVILDSSRGPVDPPIRAEIFGPERFAQHGRSLAATHRAKTSASHSTAFFPRLRDNVRTLREAHHYIALQARSGYYVSPAAEWLLDNFYLIDGQLTEIRDGLPRRYFRDLPVLVDEPLAGLPRIYGVAWAFVAHTDGAFDEELLIRFLGAYQEVRELTVGELWALPTTLRVVLVENLRRLAERVATNKAARELAYLVGDRIESYTLERLDELLGLVRRRGVGEAFLAQLARGLQDQRAPGLARYREWLQGVLPDLASVRIQQPAEQAADNLSVSNAIGSLRLIGNADWAGIIARTNVAMQLLMTIPTFAAERADTRDQTLHAIEILARRSGRSERQVAQTLLDLMQGAAATGFGGIADGTSYWLRGRGRRELTRRLGMNDWAAERWRSLWRRGALPTYLCSLAAGTVGLAVWMLIHHSAAWSRSDVPLWLTLLAATLMLVPASEAVVAVINRLICESVRPNRLPRLALNRGIPAEHRVMVVIPGMLIETIDAETLTHRLLLHYLANQERNAQFALLTDWADADAPTLPTDGSLLDDAVLRIGGLNNRYPAEAGAAPRFILLHRGRQWSDTEQRWIGWERKRGKLEQLIGVLAQPAATAPTAHPFMDLGEVSHIGNDIKYVLTLDGDTELPPGRLRELVGVASHPDNRPQVDPLTRIVTRGYGILQPRVVTPLPAAKDVTPYHWLFAGQPGIDPYSAATSEVYQDVFGEGTFTGKGLLNVAALHAVLAGRLPESQVLSHDLLEGSLARCAAVTDITLIEEAPFHADVAASRVHRWIRGDWQLLPFMLDRASRGMRAINYWKMLDNLRRSLVAPISLGLLVLALADDVVAPWAALALVFAAYTAGPLLGAVAGFAPSRGDGALRYFYRQVLNDLARALCSGLFVMAQLVQLALMSADAVVRALYRTAISRRHLLQWTTAASAQATAARELPTLLRKHWVEPATALLLFLALLRAGSPAPGLAFALCALWAASPVWTWLASRPLPVREDGPLKPRDRTYLHGVARDTWRLFERCVGATDNHLPPDNLQVSPITQVAHRTSPTNIGFYLLSAACARRFGWIGTEDLLQRLEATLQTLDELPRHRGHFLNWYDTQAKTPLMPMYVSTVDSGNLSACLLTLAQACIELASAPYEANAPRRALAASKLRIESWGTAPQRAALVAANPGSALARLLALKDPVAACRAGPDAIEGLLRDATVLLAGLLPVDDAPLADGDELVWRISDHLANLRSVLRDIRAEHPGAAGTGGAQVAAAQRLQAIVARCHRLAREADFRFLYEGRRHLLHIGYRVAEQQLDSSCYDLLASEARLTSLLSIAKGDVPVSHWGALGRPFFAVGAHAGLRSWSGSMFEYLLPSLVLDEPQGSVLQDACLAALRDQIAYGRAHRVPWGISESAYAARDHTLAYQYAPQGVPRLALRRTPQDDLVIAPYATALAAQFAPHRAATNLARLERRGARGRYGFIESLDFTPARQAGDEGVTRVATFMAHHQAMSIVALGNVLLDRAPRRWGMAEPHIEAVESLLHERAPREIPVLPEPPPTRSPEANKHRTVGLLREVVPGMGALPPTHLLSNGRYSVALRANGAGWSRWGPIGITRSRDDALRDACGSFFYLRWDRQPQAVSLTHHPAPDPEAHYESSYHADRICFDARWSEFEGRVTVWVSPEDDIEFRAVELSNRGEYARDFELISAFEVTLAESGADEAHPAFSNLFVRAHWQATHDALLFERTPRLPAEPELHAAHFFAGSDLSVGALRVETDRAKWLGRNRDKSQPLAAFDNPFPSGGDSAAGVALDTGLDPIAALSVRVRIGPYSKVRLTFCTAASDSRETLAAVIDKYRQHGPVERASMMSATLSGIRLRELSMSPENFVAIQTLTTALVQNVTRADPVDLDRADDDNHARPDTGHGYNFCDRRLLWRFGISGERPMILISASTPQAIGLVRTLVQALRVWSWGGVACDLIVINAEPRSYLMALQREFAALRERYVTESGAQPGPAAAGFVVVHEDELSADERSTLLAVARLHLEADGRPLTHHVQEWIALHDDALARRDANDRVAVSMARGASASMRVPEGAFAAQGGEFRFDVSASQRPLRPWVNVISNPDFGAQISEAGGGYSWAVNSRLNQLTPWSNDPVSDPPGEWFLLQDMKTREVWSVAPSAWGDSSASYHVSHGQGYSTIGHRRGDLEVQTSWCVDPQTMVKQIRVRLTNGGLRTLPLRVIGIAEWQMGASRDERITAKTAPFSQSPPALAVEPGDADEGVAERKLIALLCTQRERAAGFGGGTAFLALVDGADGIPDWTCDRRECFDARGRLVVPERFGQVSGAGLDPCAAIARRLRLTAGQSIECVFLLGYGASPAEARQVTLDAAAVDSRQRLNEARAHWNQLLDAITVNTPDPLFDVMVNRWLPYQTLSCRLWARAGFYQAGGAFGFRDQLQDAMALTWTAPAVLRQQILLCASRQFAEGDVQHWWHPPNGAGVRTHFSDDLLWLPHACVHYVQCTGDAGLLDHRVPFISGPSIPEGAEDAYYVPTVSGESATLFEHCARAIDRSLRVGAHGLPLMGTGDWNDGMNRVGHQGRGESVWLAWFFCLLVADFAPLARARGEETRALLWESARRGWTQALQEHAWDGEWYKRAFFDDGTPLGSHVKAECRIDLIAQAWAVISNAAPPALQRAALASMDQLLVDREAGLIKLLTPPLFAAQPSPGYIQAYPKGVRENGGHYSHAGVWALIAQARIGNADAAYRYFTYLSSAHRTREAERATVYGVEPYVIAGDVYSEPPYVGRGGWSWYTGSAGWLHRAAIEAMFGMRQRADAISFEPCLPSHWNGAELTLRRDGRTVKVIFTRPRAREALAPAATPDRRVLRIGEALRWCELGSSDECVVILPAMPTEVSAPPQPASATAH